MKQLLFSLLILLPAALQAQNQPVEGDQPNGGSAAINLPDPYNSNGNGQPLYYNYIQTWAPTQPTTATSKGTATTHSMSTTYYNGFGQTLQSNVRLVRDLVTVYDNRAMLEKPAYLPYAATVSGVNFQQNGFGDQKSWYLAQYAQEGDNAYSRTNTVSAGGQRSTIAYPPGRSFTGSNRGTTVTTEINTAARPVRLLRTDIVGNSCEYVRYYSPGELIVKHTQGQHAAESYEYANRNGQLVCKQVADGNNTWMTTYYVYDELGRITWIITPKATAALEQALWSGNLTAVFEGLCHRYVYNSFGQLIERRIPDKDGWELTVYDQKHRPVLTQTPLLKTRNQWAFQVYDSRGRVVFSGLTTGTLNNRQAWQDLMDNPAAVPSNTVAAYLLHECNGAQPEVLSDAIIYQHNYYDSYSFDPSLPVSGRSYYNAPAADYVSLPTNVFPVPYTFVQGKLTATRTRVLGVTSPFAGSWTSAVYFYDQKGRTIQAQTQYPWAQGWDIACTQYTFTGAVARTMLYHQALPGSLKTGVTKMFLTRNYELGQLGRVANVTLTMDGKLVPLANYSYDDLGRLSLKTLGGGIEKQQYTYNIRGQLTGINPNYVWDGTYPDATFGCGLSYDYGFTGKRFDGSLAGVVWRGAGANAPVRAYGYGYDAAGRMTFADFNQRTTGTASTSLWDKTVADYSVSGIDYDQNGNMLHMSQQGVAIIGGHPAEVDMDRLSYKYQSNSNRLEQMDDAIPEPVNRPYELNDFVDGHSGGADYTYDADGNLASDLNKGIGTITYNYLDLPETVNGTEGSVQNVYDATGTLLQKTITPKTGHTKVYRYAGPFVYEDDQLSYALHEEGRVRWLQDSLGWRYDFFVKDHLGNIRTVVTRDQAPVTRYLATHEPRNLGNEAAKFSLGDREPKPASVNSNDVTAVELFGSDPDKRIGTSLLLKVMAGDRFQASVDAYYDPGMQDEGEGCDNEAMIGSLISALSGGMTELAANEGWDSHLVQDLLGTDNFTSAYEALQQDNTDPASPMAYLNYMLFDEQMQPVPDGSGLIQVGSSNSGQWGRLEMAQEKVVTQNGFLVVFMSSRDPKRVSMDNLDVTYSQGRLLEEQHYYPHGLVARDGSHTPLVNRYLYQGKELQDEAGLQLYDFHARQYDPQIGRFWGVDPADQFPSGYTGMGNDPANGVDPDGMIYTGANGIGGGASDNQSSGMSGEVMYNSSDGTFFKRSLEYMLANGYITGLGGGGGGPELKDNAAQADFKKQSSTPALGFQQLAQYADGGAISALTLAGFGITLEGAAAGAGSGITIGALIDGGEVVGASAASTIGAGLMTALGVFLPANIGGPPVGTIPPPFKIRVSPLQRDYGNLAMYATTIIKFLGQASSNRDIQVYRAYAATDGIFPIVQKGIPGMAGSITLKAGETWKYGTTYKDNVYGNSISSSRYTPSSPQDKFPSNLRTEWLFRGNKLQSLFVEHMLIMNHFFEHGALPPGNKVPW